MTAVISADAVQQEKNVKQHSLGLVFYALAFVLLLTAGVYALTGAAGVVPGRAPAPFPRSADSMSLPAFEAWLSDRVPFRAAMIRFASAVRERVFRTGSDEVIVGRDGFLFFTAAAGDYCGVSPMSEADVSLAADRFSALSELVSSSGGRLILAVAPNKNTVYPEKMPARYPRAVSPSNMDRLYEALDARGVLYADLRPALRTEGRLTYHLRDTHWNGLGASIAFETIMDALALPHELYSALPSIAADGFVCDLDELLYPGAGHTFADLVPDADLSAAWSFTSPSDDPMSLRLTTEGAGQGRLLVFRDSFGSALIPFFSAAFAEVRYERGEPYDLSLIASYRPDVVLIEIAERNLPALAEDLAGAVS